MALLLLPQSRKYGESDVSSPIRPANARDHHDSKDELPDWGAGALRPQPPISLFENVSSLAFISAEDMPEWIRRLPRSFVAAPQRGARSPCTCRDRLSLDRSQEQPQGPPHHRPVRGGKTSGRHGKWARARAEMQVKQWFGFVPDFIITLDAEYCRACGAPVFTIRGHNVEEFVGVVRRYGANAAGVRAIVDAAPARQR